MPATIDIGPNLRGCLNTKINKRAATIANITTSLLRLVLSFHKFLTPAALGGETETVYRLTRLLAWPIARVSKAETARMHSPAKASINPVL